MCPIAGFYLLSYPFSIQTLSILNETCFKIFFDAVHLAVELILQKRGAFNGSSRPYFYCHCQRLEQKAFSSTPFNPSGEMVSWESFTLIKTGFFASNSIRVTRVT